jgi:hypothetical protein
MLRAWSWWILENGEFSRPHLTDEVPRRNATIRDTRKDLARAAGRTDRWTRLVGSALAVFALSSSLAVAARAGVDPFRAMFLPESSQREPGSTFELTFEVDETARQFNGYEVRLHWDPDVLSLQSVRQGSLMADACPNNFTNLTFTDSTAAYSHVLLCGGVSLDGPGVLSIFTFRADAPGSTVVDIVSDPNRSFFDDGIFISPAHPTYPRQVELFDATVSVGGTSEVPLGSDIGTFAVRVAPNPVRSDGVIRIVFGDPNVAGEVEVVGSSAAALTGPISFELSDVTGRVVHRRTIAPGEPSISWRVVDAGGARLPAGTYFYAARSRRATTAGKIILLR